MLTRRKDGKEDLEKLKIQDIDFASQEKKNIKTRLEQWRTKNWKRLF